ncbi:MAG: ABC transporter ATP-binding protein [Plesiomonas sp.]
MAPFLTLTNITKEYGNFRALHGVYLTVQRGEFICFLGPSGCGKTTLLNIIAGLQMASSGQQHYMETEISQYPPSKRGFGMVFQNYALFPNLTVTDNITYGLRGRQWSPDQRQQRAKELLNLIGLTHVAQHYPDELSGGQQQRVALARSLANNPTLLLLDEPLSALDTQVRHTLQNELKRLQRALGLTVIMVTHDQEEAMALADRIVVMQQGEIAQIGTPEALYFQPDNRFVAEFIGNMNIIEPAAGNNQRPWGIRYEQVHVSEANELTLQQPHTQVMRIEHAQLIGPFYRLSLLMSDQKTQIFADISPQQARPLLTQTLVAVCLPEDKRCWL